jgi:hypothetical protein
MRVLSMPPSLPRWPRTTAAHSSGGGDDRFAGLASAAARAFQSRKIQRRELVDLNALILGKPRAGFRTGPVWIQASHPAMSSYVGSPAPRLDALVDVILAMIRQP